MTMRAIILAAGMGRRLQAVCGHRPKCLLEFGGKTLLRRHIDVLQQHPIEELVIATGYRADLIEEEIAAAGAKLRVAMQFNPDYEQGSVVTLWALREHLHQPGDLLLMDADMLYDCRLLERLLASRHQNCLVLDRNIGVDEEPVKLCVRDGVPVELGKQINERSAYDFCGELVGMVRLSESVAQQLLSIVERYIDTGRRQEDYEEALRELVRLGSSFGYEDCTGLPWIEIDFPEDVDRARNEILPRLC
jgi:choline kinase